jgi:hypothetical protein
MIEIRPLSALARHQELNEPLDLALGGALSRRRYAACASRNALGLTKGVAGPIAWRHRVIPLRRS